MNTESETSSIQIMTLAPGHFHAGLIHKDMYAEVDSTLNIFAPEGPELADFLGRVAGYNTRSENPTAWKLEVELSDQPLNAMLNKKPGNVMVVAGKNDVKIDYVLEAIKNGVHVYADKPLVIDEVGFEKLEQAFELAESNDLLLYDIMTERYEITSLLQKELSQYESLFGSQEKGSIDNPGISKESVHYFFKYVSGQPLVRPAWFFDSSVEGNGLVDVTTHLVDLIQWSLFPEQRLTFDDVEMQKARLWPTVVSDTQFAEVTGQELGDPSLDVLANGEMNYTLRGVHAKVRVAWDFKAPQGAGDTHYSIMRGTKANLIIQQGKEEDYVPQLYVELLDKQVEVLSEVVNLTLQEKYPGIALREVAAGKYQVSIPESYRVGHEAHFGQVTEQFLNYFKAGKIPEWEKSYMRVKYFTTTQASKLAQKK